MNKTLHFQLWAGMMALVLIVLLLLWFFQIVFLESFYTQLHLKEIRNQAGEIAQVYSRGDSDQFKDRLDTFAFANNLSIEWLDQAGNSLYITGSIGSEGQIPMARHSERGEAIHRALEGETVTFPMTHPRYGNEFLLLGLPLKTQGQVSGALLINMSLAPVEETAAILKKQLILITVILLIASLLVSYAISRKFTRPILEIKKVAENMAAGNFLSRIQGGKKDEIGMLADTINNLGQQLSKIEQLRKDLIANVSHELRTPLSLIQGYAETIRDVSGNIPEKRAKQLGIIIEEAQRLSRIVDDILNLSQLEAGYYTIRKEPFSLRETVQTVSSRYQVLSESSGVRLIVEVEDDSIIEADKTKIEQVLYNLLNNAFNHTPAGGTVSLKVMKNGPRLRVELADTGRGIAEEDLPHIWDRYYKAGKNGAIKVGTGLGLAIVKNILAAHQALFGVESTVGVGTKFWFEL